MSRRHSRTRRSSISEQIHGLAYRSTLDAIGLLTFMEVSVKLRNTQAARAVADQIEEQIYAQRS